MLASSKPNGPNTLGGLNVIRKEAWPFYIKNSGVRLFWEFEAPEGPKEHFWIYIERFAATPVPSRQYIRSLLKPAHDGARPQPVVVPDLRVASRRSLGVVAADVTVR